MRAETILKSITFQEAIEVTQSLISGMMAGELGRDEALDAIAALVQSENGARGFFVTYLTAAETLADNPAPEVIQALRSSPDIVAELLVKNLAMSTAMAITHRRQDNEAIAQKSDRVRSRTNCIIRKIALPQVQQRARLLYESAVNGEGHYKTFLERWSYDAEQCQAICQALDPLKGV